MVSYTICYIWAMSVALQNTHFGDCCGSPEWGPQRGQQKTLPKHTLGGPHAHLGGFAGDFRVPEGCPFESKICQNVVLEHMPYPLECQGGPKMAPGDFKTTKMTPNSVPQDHKNDPKQCS